MRQIFRMAFAFVWLCFLICAHLPTVAQNATPLRFDFGGAEPTVTGYVSVSADTKFMPLLGFGWLDTADLLLRERNVPDRLRSDFVFGKSAHTFRVAGLNNGLYRLTVISGDSDYGDHRTQIKIGDAPFGPLLDPSLGEFATLVGTIEVKNGTANIIFDSPTQNWVVNALTLEPTDKPQAPIMTKQTFATPAISSWGSVLQWDDPTKPLLEKFRRDVANQTVTPTGLTRDDYLKLIAGEVDFWKTHQAENGAIIDPYRKEEFQYSTPAYAHAAAALVAYANRADLLESAAKALDWSTKTLSERRAATGHEDFFAPMIAHAIPLLKPLVKPERAAQWKDDIGRFDPIKTYRVAPGGNNWNLVAAAGDSLFQKQGLREPENKFVEISLAKQGHFFGSKYGLYLEGPMPYDHFPRLWAADMLAHGYDGPYHAELGDMLRRAAITSLFMQSPWGELPAGGRSAHHQWNEAEQCVTYEIYAAQAHAVGDEQLAGVYKRAAHLALSSMQRWVRPSGEMQILKNWVDSSKNHAYEAYSAHSQYNLLPMAMLAIAYHHAENTENIKEQLTPADVGGFVVAIPELHKAFANASGTYLEIDTSADHHYDATGLIRVHSKGISPQLGPSDSVLQKPSYRVPAGSTTADTGIGISWQAPDKTWKRLGELEGINSSVAYINTTPQSVRFDVIYEGNLFGATKITEHYLLEMGRLELTTEIANYNGALRYVWPVLADDGRTKSDIKIENKTVTVSQDGGKTAQTFTTPDAATVRVENELYPNHNGWARLGVAEFDNGNKATLIIAPRLH